MKERGNNMREPNRIDKFCNSLANIWNNVPDWRFTQLIINAISAYIPDPTALFYLEDEDFIEFLRKYIKAVVNDKSNI